MYTTLFYLFVTTKAPFTLRILSCNGVNWCGGVLGGGRLGGGSWEGGSS